MKGVLVTYKGSSRTQIVPQPNLIKEAAIACSKKRRQKPVVILGTMHKAPMTGGPMNMWDWVDRESDLKCWKRSSKKAHRGWQRHPNRTRSKPRGQGWNRGSQYYQPSARLLYQQDLFSEMALPG